jgi:septal ring factor EnvC (AmiA/AmiB activator)
VAKEIFTRIAVILILAVLAWYGIGLLFGDGARTDEIRNDIREIRTEQQQATKRLTEIERGLADSANKTGAISEGLGDVATGLAEAQRRNDTSAAELTDSQSLIGEGKQVIRQIRQRGITP